VEVVQEVGCSGAKVSDEVVVVAAPVTGHTVVEMAMVSVVTWPILPGQSVTVGAHDVMV
jgi:hypothetical protein